MTEDVMDPDKAEAYQKQLQFNMLVAIASVSVAQLLKFTAAEGNWVSGVASLKVVIDGLKEASGVDLGIPEFEGTDYEGYIRGVRGALRTMALEYI